MMKRWRSYLEKSTSLALVVMLLLSIMSGMLTLSASAEGEEFPKIVNTPTMTKKYYSHRFYYQPKEYPNYGEYNGWDFSLISIQFDDTDCSNTMHKPSMIKSINAIIKDDQYNSYKFSWNFSYSEKFNIIIVDTGSMRSVYSDGRYHYLTDMLPTLNSFILELKYNDNVTQLINVDVKYDYDYVTENNCYTSEMALMKLAHCTTIDNESFYELENAIFAAKDVNQNTT